MHAHHIPCPFPEQQQGLPKSDHAVFPARLCEPCAHVQGQTKAPQSLFTLIAKR